MNGDRIIRKGRKREEIRETRWKGNGTENGEIKWCVSGERMRGGGRRDEERRWEGKRMELSERERKVRLE